MKNLFLIILIPFLFWNFNSKAQSISYRNLTTKDGLPSNTVYQIKQDKKGFIWIATANGLVRYDGISFKIFNPKEIKDKEILGIFVDKEDKVWFWNLKGRLFYVDGQVIKRFELEDRFKVNDFNQDNKGSYWFLTPDIGLFKIDKNSKAKLILKGQNFGSLFMTKDNTYVRLSGYLYKVGSNGQISNYDAFEKNFHFTSQPKTFRFYTYYLNHKFWFLNSKTSRLYKIDDKGYLTGFGFPAFRAEIGENINNFFVDNDKNYWLLTDENIFVFDSTETQKLKHFSLDFNNLNTFLHDKEGNYWFGTSKHGLVILPSLQFDIIQPKMNKKAAIISLSVINNQLFTGLDNGRFTVKSLKKSNEKVFDIQLNNPINKFVEGKNNRVWIISPVRAFSLDKNYNFKKLNRNQVNINYKDLYEDLNYLFVGNYWGVLQIPIKEISDGLGNNSWDELQKKYTIKGINHRTYAIEKVKNEYWFGSTDGLYYSNGDTAVLTKIPELQKSWITQIINQKDTVWVGTQTDGVFQIINKKIAKVFDEKYGLVSNNCRNLIVESNGTVWVGTNNGINKINIKTGEIDLINNLDGLLSNDINALALGDETIFVGTSDGLTTFNKNIQTKNKVAPPIYLSKFQIYDKDTLLLKNYILRHNQNNIRIHVTGISFRSQGTFKYKYRMRGISDEWTITQSNIASFPILTPDEYTFEAYAINEDGVESEEPVQIKIIVKAPFWQTWWFLVLIGLLILFIVWRVTQARIRRIEERLQLENDFQQKINELKMQALQAQMNPHFIFNALNAIQHYLISGNEEQATIYLAKFAKLIRKVFEYSKGLTITLTDEIEFLKLYLELEKLRFKNKIKVDFSVRPNIYTDDFKMPSLLIQPIIENAFKHGLLHKEHGSELKIIFMNENGWVKCIIEDNGIGREKAKTMRKYQNEKHNSSGVQITEERLYIWINQHRTTDEKIDCFKVFDLKDADGNAAGTRVEMILGKIEME